jgi:chaperonin GroEL
MILTTECLITDKPEEKKEGGMPSGGMPPGGMY